MASHAGSVSRLLLGEPLRSDRLGETLLPKRLALPVFCSDPLSSVAYATEQILLVLGLGGLALLHLTPWLAAAVVVLLVIVVASYRQTCFAYPNGGGAYTVSRDNLGEHASLVAATALLIDYVLTVAVSVVAGVAAITSAVPALAPHAVALSLGFVGAPHGREPARRQGVRTRVRHPDLRLRARDLRDARSSAFAKSRFGDGHHGRERALRAAPGTRHRRPADGLPASCARSRRAARRSPASRRSPTACPAFKEPKSRNAASTLVVMGVLAIDDVRRHHRARLARPRAHRRGHRRAVGFPPATRSAPRSARSGSPPSATARRSSCCRASPPRSSSSRPTPRSTASRSSRRCSAATATCRASSRTAATGSSSPTASCCSPVAALLIVAFDAEVTRLIQLYILGVFLSFTLSQAGMVRHWARELRRHVRDRRACAASRSSTAPAPSSPGWCS